MEWGPILSDLGLLSSSVHSCCCRILLLLPRIDAFCTEKMSHACVNLPLLQVRTRCTCLKAVSAILNLGDTETPRQSLHPLSLPGEARSYLWLACFDEDEDVQKTAKILLDTQVSPAPPESVHSTLMPLLSHPTPNVRNSAAQAIAYALNLYHQHIGSVLVKLTQVCAFIVLNKFTHWSRIFAV